MIFSLIREALRAYTAYVNHRTETDLDRRIDISRKNLREMAVEIDSLRSDGGPDSTQRADWLFKEYIGEAKHLAHLRARRLATEKRADSGDRGRDPQSTD